MAAADFIAGVIDAGRGGYCVAINAEKILFYRSRSDLRQVIDRASLPYPDGFGAVLGLKWLHGAESRKINMPIACIDAAHRRGWRLFVLGAQEDINATAVEAMQRRWPGLHIAGRLNGFETKERAFEVIAQANANVVMVALGSPRQEMFAAELVERQPGVFVVGCGGALDILAGKTKRAPAFMVNNGLEWLYRLWKEPHRAGRQKMLPLFLAKLMKAAILKRMTRRRA